MSSNMLGDFFLGEGLLGADPDTSTGGGNGYGNTANMLGQFMLGEPMLGADPSNGSGGGTPVVGPTGNVYRLTPNNITGATAVSGSMRENILLQSPGYPTTSGWSHSNTPNSTTPGNTFDIFTLISAPNSEQTTASFSVYANLTSLQNPGTFTYWIIDNKGNTLATSNFGPSQSASAPNIFTASATGGNFVAYLRILYNDGFSGSSLHSVDNYYFLRYSLLDVGTTVTGSLTQSSLRGSVISAGTSVTARLNEHVGMAAAVTGRTSVTGNLTRVQTLSGTTIAGSTSVSGSLTRSVLKGTSIFTGTHISGALILAQAIKVEAVRCATRVAGTLGIARPFGTTSNISCGTALTVNLTYQSRLSGGQAVGRTIVSNANLLRSNFYGQPIVCATVVTANSIQVQSRYVGTILAGTTVRIVEGGFTRRLAALTSADLQTVRAGTRVKGRVYVVPEDFVPVYLNVGTTVIAQVVLAYKFAGSVIGRASVSASALYGRVTMIGQQVKAKTLVKGGARYGNGGAINGFGYLSAALGLAFTLRRAFFSPIKAGTTIVAKTPQNGTAGHAWGGTRFALTYGKPDGELGFYVNDSNNGHYVGYNYVFYYNTHFPTLTTYIGLQPRTSAGTTRLRSLVVPSRAYYHNNKGPAPYYGPFGYVNMNRVPKGDLGLGDFIDAQTVVGANMLALRHRIMVLLSVVGLEVPGSFTFTGDAVRGSGTRNVTSGNANAKYESDRGPVSQNAYYA